MGSGVAKQVRKQFPHVYKKYVEHCKKDPLGDVLCQPTDPKYLGASCGSHIYEGRYIVNMFSQNN